MVLDVLRHKRSRSRYSRGARSSISIRVFQKLEFRSRGVDVLVTFHGGTVVEFFRHCLDETDFLGGPVCYVLVRVENVKEREAD